MIVSIRLRYEVQMDQRVIDRCVNNEDGWREAFYDFRTARDVAEHLAWNMGVNGLRLSQVDGFADLPDDAVKVQRTHVEFDEP